MLERSEVNVRFFRIGVALVWLVAVTGCIAVPIKGGEPHPFSTERLAFIQLGETGMDRVLEELGIADDESSDGYWWIYDRRRVGAEWFVAGGSGYMGWAETIPGDITQYRLLIGFQEDQTVFAYGVFKDDDTCDKKRGICFEERMVFIHKEPGSDDPENCGLYYDVASHDEQYGCVYGPV
jgi:hypothetical protein